MAKDVIWLLDQWRVWQLSKTGIPRYISPAFVMIRDNVEQMIDADLTPLLISDDAALEVDRVIAQLRGRSEHWYQVIKLYHGPAQMTMRSIAKELKTNHQQISIWLDQARAWIDGKLLSMEVM